MNQSINTDSNNKQQQGTTTEAPPWNGQYKNTGGLKPVLRVPNPAVRTEDLWPTITHISLCPDTEGYSTASHRPNATETINGKTKDTWK